MAQDVFLQSPEAAARFLAFIGRRIALSIAFSAQFTIILLMPSINNHRDYDSFVALEWVMVMFTGGTYGTIPSLVTDLFGTKNVFALQSVLMSAYLFSSLSGGLIFTSIFNHLRSIGHSINDPITYNLNFYLASVALAIGWLSIRFIRTDIRDRLYPAVKGQIFRFRPRHRIIRYSTSRD
eukprot:gene16012-19057_t